MFQGRRYGLQNRVRWVRFLTVPATLPFEANSRWVRELYHPGIDVVRNEMCSLGGLIPTIIPHRSMVDHLTVNQGVASSSLAVGARLTAYASGQYNNKMWKV